MFAKIQNFINCTQLFFFIITQNVFFILFRKEHCLTI